MPFSAMCCGGKQQQARASDVRHGSVIFTDGSLRGGVHIFRSLPVTSCSVRMLKDAFRCVESGPNVWSFLQLEARVLGSIEIY